MQFISIVSGTQRSAELWGEVLIIETLIESFLIKSLSFGCSNKISIVRLYWPLNPRVSIFVVVSLSRFQSSRLLYITRKINYYTRKFINFVLFNWYLKTLKDFYCVSFGYIIQCLCFFHMCDHVTCVSTGKYFHHMPIQYVSFVHSIDGLIFGVTTNLAHSSHYLPWLVFNVHPENQHWLDKMECSITGQRSKFYHHTWHFILSVVLFLFILYR